MIARLTSFLVVFAAHAATACSENKADRAAEPGSAAGAQAAAQSAKQAIDPDRVGRIQGVVRFQGDPPLPRPLPIAEPACRALQQGPVMAKEVVVTDGKLKNVFVYVKDLGRFQWPAPTGSVAIDQKGCVYDPLVVGVRVGQPLRFLNSDPVLHNVHTLAEENRSKNFAMPAGMKERTVTFSKPEVMVKTTCDIHPWMRSYIGVLDHPAFAVTAADGTFRFANIPAGKYTVVAWHEKYGTREKVANLAAGEAAQLEFVFP